MPDFPIFYRAINDRKPFPWQSRLARRLADTEQWDDEIGVPTGLGKTACLDIAIWWLASQAHLPTAERSAPTRIWWVVNRRLLVDSTFEHANRIRERLVVSMEEGDHGCELAQRTLAAVAERLSALSANTGAAPLEVIRLRGGVERGRPIDPSQPTVILATLPMYGSRLLFRGYGTSVSMRPIDAALAGTDSLILLDEAHLARHLKQLLNDLSECAPAKSSVMDAVRASPRLVALTATGDDSEGSRFDLDEDDRAHDIVKERLHASKPMEVRCAVKGDIAMLLADEARKLIKTRLNASAILVFANTPATARAVFNRLNTQGKDRIASDVLLLTGRTREVEAERIRSGLLDEAHGMAASRNRSAMRERHLVVVATQTLEVGADLDAEYLVTEACGVRALTQRLGRLNRLGRYKHARAIYVHLPPKGSRKSPPQWPVYGSEPAEVLGRLRAACDKGTNVVQMNPERVSEVLGPPVDDPGRAPEILYGLLWEWLKTTTPPKGEAPVEPYFSGIAGPANLVSLIWRVHVPEPGDRLWPRIREVETVDVPIRDVRDVLDGDEIRRVESDGVTIESCRTNDLRPGDLVVLPADKGLLDGYGWNPECDEPVFDASLPLNGLPLDGITLKRLCGTSVADHVRVALGDTDEEEDIEEPARLDAVKRILGVAASAKPPTGWSADDWSNFINALNFEITEPRGEVPRLMLKNAASRVRVRLDEYDEMSMASHTVDLDSHGRSVGERARSVAERLGVSDELIDVLYTAGRLHDIGKAERRFQRWLDPDGVHRGIALAKSDTPRHLWARHRVLSGWPRGGRHEALSARLAEKWLDSEPDWGDLRLRQLLLHLVISHHGKGRPLVEPVEDSTAATVSAKINGASLEASANLADIDWTQPARFRWLNEEFGPWGLALLEAILRQADHAVSGDAV